MCTWFINCEVLCVPASSLQWLVAPAIPLLPGPTGLETEPFPETLRRLSG